jgi:hypothetical protein
VKNHEFYYGFLIKTKIINLLRFFLTFLLQIFKKKILYPRYKIFK